MSDDLTDQLTERERAVADRLAAYLAAMDRAGGGIYTADFRNGFRHALAMLDAYHQPDSAGEIRPEVREAARAVLALREGGE